MSAGTKADLTQQGGSPVSIKNNLGKIKSPSIALYLKIICCCGCNLLNTLSFSEMYAKRKLTEVSIKKKFPLVPIHTVAKPRNCSPTGFGSTASESRGQNFNQRAELFQNPWVCHIFLHRWPLLLMFHSLLQHLCTEPCPSRTWARWRNRGKTSPWTAACLWLSPSWCSPQASKGCMVTKTAR